MSGAGMTETEDCTRPICSFCELKSMTCNQRRRERGPNIPNVKVRSAREPTRALAKRKATRGSTKSGSVLSYSLEYNAAGDNSGRREPVRRRENSPLAEVKEDRSMKTECRESDIALQLARQARSSLSTDTPGVTDVPDTASSGKISIMMIAVTSPATWKGNVSTKYYENFTATFLKYVSVHKKRVRVEAKGFGTAGWLEPIPKQAVMKIETTRMKTATAQRPRHGTSRASLNTFFQERVFCADQMMKDYALKKLKLMPERCRGD